jgi:hypothetical protein
MKKILQKVSGDRNIKYQGSYDFSTSYNILIQEKIGRIMSKWHLNIWLKDVPKHDYDRLRFVERLQEQLGMILDGLSHRKAEAISSILKQIMEIQEKDNE